jgi:hypothetical protein
MPDARLQKTRATLPEGYQFGDAGVTASPRFWLWGDVTREHYDFGTHVPRVDIVYPSDDDYAEDSSKT